MLITENMLKNLKEFTTNSPLKAELLEIFTNTLERLFCEDDTVIEVHMEDFNPSTGAIPELIYYYQTSDIFKRNFEEILELYSEYVEETGSHISDLNSNILVWISFEYCVSQWLYMLEDGE